MPYEFHPEVASSPQSESQKAPPGSSDLEHFYCFSSSCADELPISMQKWVLRHLNIPPDIKMQFVSAFHIEGLVEKSIFISANLLFGV